MAVPTPIQNGQVETDSPDKRGSIIKTPYNNTKAQRRKCELDCRAEFNRDWLGWIIWTDDEWVKVCADKCMGKIGQETLRQGLHPEMIY